MHSKEGQTDNVSTLYWDWETYCKRTGMSQESIDRGNAWNEHLKKRQQAKAEPQPA